MKSLAVFLALLIAGCLSLREPHVFWTTPAVELRGRLSGDHTRVDSVRILRASATLDDLGRQNVRRRVGALLDGDTEATNEYYQVRTVPVEEGGTFKAAFPPVLYYGAMSIRNSVLDEEVIYVRVPPQEGQALVIPLRLPHEPVALDLGDWQIHAVAEAALTVRVSEKLAVPADTSGLVVVEVEVH